MQIRKLFSLAGLFLLISVRIYSQELVFPVRNYTTKDYGRDFHPANMAVAQDKRGLIYAANGFKLLEFDGRRWNSYPINREAWILSIAIDSSGIIYTGSQNEFGYFTPVKSGGLKYVSLSDSLNAADLDFTNVWKVSTYSGGTVFQSEEKLFIYNRGKIRVINPETSFHTSFVINDRLYVRQRERGLYVLGEKELSLIPGSEIFSNSGVFVMLPFGKGKILAGTRDDGFWIFDETVTNPGFHPFVVKDINLIKESVLSGGTLTGNGGLALGTILNGIIIVDSTGTTKSLINTYSGLGDNEVKQLINDSSGDLWAATNNGISRIEVSSPVSVYSEKAGITGSVNAVARFGNLLYAGTSSGLFIQSSEKMPVVPFVQVKGISSAVRSLIVASGNLYAGTDDGLFMVSKQTLRRIDNEAVYSMFFMKQRSMLFCGGPAGLRTFCCEKNNSKKGSLKITGEDIIGITGPDSKTSDSTEIWLGTRYNGVIRLRLKSDDSYTADHYTNQDGLPEGPVIPSLIEDQILFETISGLFTFVNEAAVREALPDSLKNRKEFIKGYFSALKEKYSFPGEAVSALAEDRNKLWICSDNKIGWFDKKDKYRYNSKPFSDIDAGKINIIFPETDIICWIGATEGLIRFDENCRKDYDRKDETLIRKVAINDTDSVLFLGNGYTDLGGIRNITSAQGPDQYHTLSYRNNSLRFEFAAPDYSSPEKILYSYRLGNNSRWSQWSPEIYRELTNIREGEYVFSVKAKTVYGNESIPGEYRFTILPPWYRSLPAYIIYLILSALLLWGFARIYSYRLKRENIRLEGIITERTAEIVRQKDEIVEKNTILEHQKKEIEDSIRYASRIQSAVIPSEKACRDICPQTFVLFRPLNIVSGDFYWISRTGDKIIYTAADCTGHGVPGAFMSMLGVAFLNEIVNKDHVTSPDLILNQVRSKVIHALQQQGVTGEARDGMDIAIVSIDTVKGVLAYAGAYNPLIMIRKGELKEFPGEKMPIGYYENMRNFVRHEVKLEEGDVFYMYSDGYEDQFGGADGKKFKSKRLKSLLLEISELPVEQQKEILEKQFMDWKGDLPQIDDVVIVGIKISGEITA